MEHLIQAVKQGGGGAGSALLKANKDFLAQLAEQYKGKSNLSQPLLEKAAGQGMIEAALEFEENKGPSFLAYTVWYCRQHMLKAIHGA